MKTYPFYFIIFLVTALQFICCTDRFSAGYVLDLPEPPSSWVSLLGEPVWRVEWLDPEGAKQIADLQYGGSIEAEIPVTWVNPVSAWPYWPSRSLPPGIFKPAGALFPFDASGSELRLSWEGGVDAVFYWELLMANGGKESRLPANFDWPRFREIFKSGTLKEAVREDPWVVDWRYFAEKTVASTFYQSRLSAEAVTKMTIDVPDGPWYGTSPFAKPLLFTNGEIPSFPVRTGLNLWVCGEGILRVSGKTWIYQEFDRAVSSRIASRSLSIIDSICP